jgi:pimeloyl-ACP methyl ester carboxylesterase
MIGLDSAQCLSKSGGWIECREEDEMPVAKVNGINIAYDVSGQGEPLILIMGPGGTRQSWFFQERAFSKHFKVITFDNRGVGKSDRPDEPYTIRTMADDVIGLLNHLGINRAHVLGVSGGGRIAQEVAINYPGRVIKLVLASTNHGGEDEVTPEMQKVLGVADYFSQNDTLKAGMSKCPVCQIEAPKKELWEHQWSAHRQQMLEWARSADWRRMAAQSFNKRPYRTVISLLAWLQVKMGDTGTYVRFIEASVGSSTLDRLHLIAAPTLVIVGTEDNLCPPHSSEVMAEKIPNAKLVKVEGGSHAQHVEMRGRFNREVLDFLRSC